MKDPFVFVMVMTLQESSCQRSAGMKTPSAHGPGGFSEAIPQPSWVMTRR